MTTMIHTREFLAADRMILIRTPGGISRRVKEDKLLFNDNKTMVMFCKGTKMDKSQVDILSWLLPPVFAKLKTSDKTIEIAEEDFPSREEYASMSILLNDDVVVFTKRESYYVFKKDDKFLVGSVAGGDSYFGSGGILASVLSCLTKDLKEIYHLVSKLDDCTSDDFNVVYRNDLNDIKEVV